MNTNIDIGEVNNQTNIDPLKFENITQKSRLKLLENRKLLANGLFGKLGNLTNEGSLTNKDVSDMGNKVSVMDLLSSSYNGDIGYDFHRPCNCTKSYCLKLYCECFARDKLCVNCNCNNCMNNLSHEKSRSTALLRILDKNPLAFLPKIGSGQGQKLHRKGCNCKRSECLKNYCECREAKIECSLLCRCQGCKNRTSELSTHSSQVPCSLDMSVMESEGYKPSTIPFKSNSGLITDKPQEDGVELNFPFRTMYDESNFHQSNAYCNGGTLSNFSSGIPYLSTVNSMDDLVKYNELYTKMNENIYKPDPSINDPSEDVTNKQSQPINWNPYMNVNNESMDYKQMPYNNMYHPMNFDTFHNSHILSHQCPISTIPKPLDLDNNIHRIVPGNSAHYMNDSDEYFDLPSSNYYKTFNAAANQKRFHDSHQYPYPRRMDSQSFEIQPPDKGEQDDDGEVTSTSEMEAGAMMVSSNYDNLPQQQCLPDNSLMKPSRCDSRSSMPLIPNENFNCFPFSSDPIFQNNLISKSNFPLKYSSQNMNGHVLPSLFNSGCEASDIAPHLSFFRSVPVSQSHIISNDFNSCIGNQRRLVDSEDCNNKYLLNANYENLNTSNFYNFYNESLPSFVGNTNEEILHKSESMKNASQAHTIVYPDNLDHVFYSRNSGGHQRPVTRDSNAHQ